MNKPDFLESISQENYFQSKILGDVTLVYQVYLS